MRFNKNIPVFGDITYRGDCPKEDIEQINFYSYLKEYHPIYHMLMIHPKSEGKRNGGQVNYESRTGGIPTGASDLIIPGNPCFVVELKRRDHTKSNWQPQQQPYLLAAKEAGCFVGVALGFEGAKEALELWLTQKDEK